MVLRARTSKWNYFVKITRVQVFTSKSSKDDIYFLRIIINPGFLWKTLFPKTVGESETLILLNDALLNISKHESRDGELICYYKIDEPLNCMRISFVLYQTAKLIHSILHGLQPNTGNNGKPFSFF